MIETRRDEIKAHVAFEKGSQDWQLSAVEIENLLDLMDSHDPLDFGDYGSELLAALLELQDRRAA